jgi:hypothetical protein
MVYAATLVAPIVLLALMMVMERVEQPLRRDAVGQQLVDFLETARPEEVETYVSEGFAPALERYWSRRRSGVARQPRAEMGRHRGAHDVPVG